MPDPRFFENLGPAPLSELAALAGSKLEGPAAERPIRTAAILSRADGEAVTFLTERRHAASLDAAAGAACFVTSALSDALPPGWTAVVTPLPQAAYVAAAERLHRARAWPSGTAGAHRDAEIEDDVVLGAGAVVGPGAQIGRGTRVAAGAVIGPGVAIGRGCYIGPNAVVAFALVGDRVKILGGAVVGEAGFGATLGPRGIVDVPQLGRVILQDGVTIGANSTVDRGAWEDTVIGENTKVDNLVQIAHNVVIGRNCVLAAQTGVSGSVTIGDGCQLGGRVGLADHLKVGDGARLGANSGVIGDVPAGATWAGFPARPRMQWLRETAWLVKAARRKGADE
jgi:UDP-3-O-[3-hydroxymyristoyl] glucosamine N-acyltransferase